MQVVVGSFRPRAFVNCECPSGGSLGARQAEACGTGCVGLRFVRLRSTPTSTVPRAHALGHSCKLLSGASGREPSSTVNARQARACGTGCVSRRFVRRRRSDSHVQRSAGSRPRAFMHMPCSRAGSREPSSTVNARQARACGTGCVDLRFVRLRSTPTSNVPRASAQSLQAVGIHAHCCRHVAADRLLQKARGTDDRRSAGQRGSMSAAASRQRWRRRAATPDSASRASAPGAGACAGIFALPSSSLSPKSFPWLNFIKRATNA